MVDYDLRGFATSRLETRVAGSDEDVLGESLAIRK